MCWEVLGIKKQKEKECREAVGISYINILPIIRMSILVDPIFQQMRDAKNKAQADQAVREAPARLAAQQAKAAALERLRAKYPELFSLNPEDLESPPYPAATYLKTLGIDVSKEGFLEVLLRPHLMTIQRNRSAGDVKQLRTIVDDVLNKLDIDEMDVDMYIYPYIFGQGPGPRWTNATMALGLDRMRSTIDYLQAAVRLAAPPIGGPLKTRTQKAAERQAKANAVTLAREQAEVRRVERNALLAEHGVKINRPDVKRYGTIAAAAEAEERLRNRKYAEIITRIRKTAPPSANLLGLHEKPEENLLIFPSREEELASVFKPANSRAVRSGAPMTEVQKYLATSSGAASGGAGGKAKERKRSRKQNRRTRRRKN